MHNEPAVVHYYTTQSMCGSTYNRWPKYFRLIAIVVNTADRVGETVRPRAQSLLTKQLIEQHSLHDAAVLKI